MNYSVLFAGLIFGAIGFVAFVYGKKQSRLMPMLWGAALLSYSYFVPHPVWNVVVGIVLTAALFIFK